MSKTASPALYELIHSLTKSEKRYFKIYASRHTIGEVNNGIRIFDFIDQQSNFDEEELRAYFKGEAFLNQFPITKNRLYEQILNALDAFHIKSDIEAQINQTLHSARILYSKSLYDHAEKALAKAKKQAIKNEKSTLLLQILDVEKKVIETRGYARSSKNKILKSQNNSSLLIQQHAFGNKLWHLKAQLFILLNQKGQARSDEMLAQYQDIYKTYKEIEIPHSLSFYHQYLQFHFESAYHFAIAQHGKCLKYLRLNILHFKENPNKITKFANEYFSILTNTIHILSKSQSTKEMVSYLNELKGLAHQLKSAKNEDLKIKLFSSINSIELKMLNHQAKFEHAIQLVSTIEAGLIKYDEELTPARKAYLAFNIAIAYFGVNEFNKSLKWINMILNNKCLDQKEDIVSFAHLVNLIIHFELKNNELLPYAIKNTKRFLSKRKRTYTFETVFLQYISKINQANDKYEIELYLSKIETELLTLKNDPYESIAFDYFDFHIWLKSKVKNKSFQLIKREEFLKATA
ncbi:hypothetical protein CW751_12945 [Brumimicrobium salinarum]|uniref:Uncharacterized protein n=1 Tax=Brumimicrobium salinarum TaxID=2058658 RepID=A0A2I0QZT7_9FLAO|nr:hypothetical protein [Brumimicrobium salinarum]PKR79856.1 hypothetical protein CW751_12945 [Brumimicrobium salinarum]